MAMTILDKCACEGDDTNFLVESIRFIDVVSVPGVAFVANLEDTLRNFLKPSGM